MNRALPMMMAVSLAPLTGRWGRYRFGSRAGDRRGILRVGWLELLRLRQGERRLVRDGSSFPRFGSFIVGCEIEGSRTFHAEFIAWSEYGFGLLGDSRRLRLFGRQRSGRQCASCGKRRQGHRQREQQARSEGSD